MEHNHNNTKDGIILNFTRPTGSVQTDNGVYSFSEHLVFGRIYRNAKVKVETDNNNRLVKIYGEDVKCCNPHIGSTFESFVKEEDLEIDWSIIEDNIKKNQLSKKKIKRKYRKKSKKEN